MPTFLQQTLNKKRSKKRVRKNPKVRRSSKRPRTKYPMKSRYGRIKKNKKTSSLLSKEQEGLLRTTGAMVGLGAAVGTMGLIGKLGK